MHQPSLLVLLAFVLATSTVTGAKQVFLSGATLRSPCSSQLAIDADSYSALLSSLIGQSPKKPVDIQTSAKMDKLLQPSASLQPGSLLSLHISGVADFDGIMDSQEGHQVTVTGLDKLRSTPLASVLSQGVSAGSLDHSPLGISSRCSNVCMEQLLQEALAPLNGSYTATGMPFQGIVALPAASGSTPVEMSLKQIAAQAWATEVALLHASGMTAEAQAANRQQVGAQLRPVVLEGTLQSPKLLAAAHGSNAPETTAAVSALGGAIQKLQQQLSSVFNDRLALHMTSSNEPLKKADVKAALAMKDSQGRRRLMSSVAASGKSKRRDGLGFMAGAFAWITGLIILVFAIACCKVLGSMEYQQDSLLYGRSKTD